MDTNSISFFKEQESLSVEHKPIVAAWQIKNPGNIGSIIRLADNAGADTVYILEDDQPKKVSSIRKTAGLSFKNISLEFISFDRFMELLPEGYKLVAIETSSGSTDIYQTKLPSKMAILLGNEQHGIPEEIIKRCDSTVYIPMIGRCKSMNVSQAFAVSIFEWLRQQLYS